MSTKIFHKLSGEMAVHGTLLLIFGLLLLGLKPIDEIVVFQFAPIPPDFFYNTAWGWIFVLISLAVLFAVLGTWRKYKLASSLKRWLKILIKSFVCLLILFILWLVPTVPTCFFTGLWIFLGVIFALASLAFMFAVFYEPFAGNIKDYLERQFQYLYLQIFMLVYLGSWLKGLSIIPTDEPIFVIVHKAVYWIGFAWFLVIWILTLRSFPKSGKKTDQTK